MSWTGGEDECVVLVLAQDGDGLAEEARGGRTGVFSVGGLLRGRADLLGGDPVYAEADVRGEENGSRIPNRRLSP